MVINNYSRFTIQNNLDEINLPDWQNFEVQKYHENRFVGGMYSENTTIPILATRGCPYQCTYCSAPNMWLPKWIPRDPIKVVDEISYYKRVFNAKNFPNSEVHCVDTWIKTEEYSKDINFSEIEKNFDYNTSEFKKLNKHKKTSDSFFEKNRINFDVIYIDGYHFGPQVYKDVTNAWKFLKVGGYLICDDYIWNIKSEIKLTPCYSINKFLNTINNNYKVEIVSNSQIFFKKIR